MNEFGTQADTLDARDAYDEAMRGHVEKQARLWRQAVRDAGRSMTSGNPLHVTITLGAIRRLCEHAGLVASGDQLALIACLEMPLPEGR